MRFLTLLLTLLLVFSLVACGGAEEESKPAFSNDNSAPQEESKPVSEPESSAPEASGDASTESSDVSGEDDENSDPFVPITYEKAEIKKATGEIKVDGKITEGEYATVFEYDANSTFWNVDSTETASNYEPKLYIAWDEEYLYTAVALIPGSPRTYDNDDYAGANAQRPYLFDRRHVMCATILDDPTDPKYIPPKGSFWSWEDACAQYWSNEWAISSQPDGTKIFVDYFGELTTNSKWEYVLLPGAYDIEVYEQAIPWTALANGFNFEAKAGEIIGFAFSALCEEANLEVEQGEDENAIYAAFGSGINSGKNFAYYVGLTLVD